MVKKLKRRSQQAKIPAQIHVLDRLTDRIIHTLDNKAGRLFWDDEHLNTLQDESVYDFITRYNNSEALKGRNRLIIPSEGGEFYHELIIDETIKQGDTKEVYSTASYLDLRKAKVIPPWSFEATKLHIMANAALGSTEWALGRVENDGRRSLMLDGYTNPYRMLRRIATLFGMEIRFRIVSKNGRVIGRYVDFLQQRGEWRGKEVTLGKDLKGVIRKENTEDVISALVVVGPEYEDENGETQRIVTEVTDEEARQRWSRNGAHVWDYHEPETDDENITEARLQTIGRTELNKRIAAAVTYEADTVSVEDVFGLEHEKTRLGDTIRVKDTSYEPPLYMEARVFSIRRSIANPARKVYDLGDFVELEEADIYAIQRKLEVKIASRVSRRRLEEYAEKKRIVSNEPPDDPDVIWEDPTQTPHVFNVYNGEAWVKATPTLPGEVGAYGKDEVDRKLETAENAVNEASRRYTQNFYMDEIEVDLQRAREYTDEEVSSRVKEIRSDLYDAISDAESNFSRQITDRTQEIRSNLGTQKTELQNDISHAKSELSDNLSNLNSDLTDEINRKIEAGDVDEAISGLVRTVDYEGDQDRQVSRFRSNETKIEQNENEISQQAQRIEQNENELSEARTSLTQTADLLEQKAENSRVNELAGTLEENSAAIRTVSDAVDIRVTENRLQESIDAIEIGGRNRVKNSDFSNGNTHWASLGTIYEEGTRKYIAQNYGWSTRQVSIPVAPGKTHTVSGLVRNPTGSTSAQFRASIRGYKGNTDWQKNVYVGNLSTDWRRESASFVVPEDVTEIHVYFLNADSGNTDVYLDMTDFQIEVGTKATDYEQSPEDTARRFESVESSIRTEAGRIDAESKRISDLDGDLSETRGRVSVLTDEVDIRVTDKTFNSGIDSAISEAKQYTDNLEIGTRNLMTSSNHFSNRNGYSGASATYTENVSVSEWGADDATRIRITGGDNTVKWVRSVLRPAPKGEKYTLSVWVHNQNDLPIRINTNSGGSKTLEPGFKGRVVITATGNGRSHFQLQIRTENVSDDVDVIVWRAKTEKGSKATDWTEAPEDTEGKIERNETSINTVSDEVSIQSRRLSEAQNEISEAQSELSVQADEIASKVERSDYQRKIGDIENDLDSKSQKYPIEMRSTDDLVILLTRAGGNGTQNYINGKIYGKRGNSSNVSAGQLDIVANSNSSGDYLSGYMEVSDTQNDDWQLITCNYNGITYIAIRRKGNVYRIWDQYCYFIGDIASTEEMLKFIDIDSSNHGVSNIKDFNSRFTPSTPFIRANTKINQTADEVSVQARRITEVGDDISDARSEINALAGEVEIKAAQIEVNDIEGRLSEAESSLRVLPGEIDAKVSVDEIITRINLSSEGVRIDGDKNRITGETTIENGVIDNAMIRNLDGRKIIADSITATQMNIADLSAITANLGSVFAGELTAVDLYGSSFQMRGNGYRMDIADGRILTRDTSGSRERRALFDTASLYLFEVNSNGLPTSPDISITPNRIRARPDLVIEAKSIQLDGGDVLRMSNGTSIDNSGGNPRVRKDNSRYILQTSSHIDFYQRAENSSNRTFRFGTDSRGGWYHRTMESGNGTLKFLNGGTDAIQFRNAADTAYIRLQASEFITGSMRETKENIVPYKKSVLDRIKDTQIYTYKLRSEKFDNTEDRYKLGMMYEEAPRFLKNSGGGINHYGAIATLWKAVQELTVKIEALEAEKEGLKAA